ncbi:MAG: enolase C-terminal domain-like protein [Acetobacteraceae bacterium]
MSRITALRTKRLEVPLPTPIMSGLGPITTTGVLLVFLESDQGVVGENLIFTLNNKRLAVLDEMVRSLEPLVVGLDPQFSLRFWSDAWREINFFGHTGVPVVGISAIDGALWDLRGKLSDLPIHRLIGARRATVPTYASAGLWLSSDVDALQREAQGFVEQGFRAVKMRLGKPTPAEDAARVAAVREAIGPDIALMADANQQLTVDQAIRLGRLLEPHGLTWFEEPLPAYDLEGVARVAAALDTPIASGETEYTRYGFRRMLELKSADVLMPDLQRVGGVTEFLRVGHMADAFDVPVASHLFPEMSVQVLAALGNGSWLEHMPWFAPLYAGALELRDGEIVVPEGPGWGLAFDPAAITRFRA